MSDGVWIGSTMIMVHSRVVHDAIEMRCSCMSYYGRHREHIGVAHRAHTAVHMRANIIILSSTILMCSDMRAAITACIVSVWIISILIGFLLFRS